MKRIHLIISGDVQGVGFRAWMRREAQKLNLTGWVKNREDGSVETMAEGSEEKLQKLIELCRQGPEASWVDDVKITWQDFQNEFTSFEIAL